MGLGAHAFAFNADLIILLGYIAGGFFLSCVYDRDFSAELGLLGALLHPFARFHRRKNSFHNFASDPASGPRDNKPTIGSPSRFSF